MRTSTATLALGAALLPGTLLAQAPRAVVPVENLVGCWQLDVTWEGSAAGPLHGDSIETALPPVVRLERQMLPDSQNLRLSIPDSAPGSVHTVRYWNFASQTLVMGFGSPVVRTRADFLLPDDTLRGVLRMRGGYAGAEAEVPVRAWRRDCAVSPGEFPQRELPRGIAAAAGDSLVLGMARAAAEEVGATEAGIELTFDAERLVEIRQRYPAGSACTDLLSARRSEFGEPTTEFIPAGTPRARVDAWYEWKNRGTAIRLICPRLPVVPPELRIRDARHR